MSAEFMELFGMLLEMMGTLLVAYAALRVHHRFRHEHKVDEEVFNAMTSELKLGIIGIFFVIVGFMFQVAGRFILL